jgi:ATP-dependent helicase/nuclease subunit A
MTELIDWPGQSPAPEKFVFLVSEKRPPICAEAILVQEQQARGREELNALYVAMTRARSTLVISSVQPHRETTHSWWQRLQALMSPLSVVPTGDGYDMAAGSRVDSAEGSVPEPAVIAEPTFSLPVLPPLSEALQRAALIAAAGTNLPAESPLSARIGKAMHRLLEWGVVAFDATPIPAAAVTAAAHEFALSPAQAQEAARMAQRIASGAGAWVWQPDVIAWQGNEVDMLYQGQALRLDRLVQRKDAQAAGHWWVLDYKSDARPEQQPELVSKMQIYRAAVQQAYPGAVVKAAFLTGDGRVVEVGD